jgi:N-acetylmuramoyl-L-alanine amidase
MMPCIVVDAGHGGASQTGGSSPTGVRLAGGAWEKDVALDLARRVARHLAPDAVMTRQGDVNLPISERIAVARKLGAQVFLSVHANQGHGGGTQIWVHPQAGARSQALAESVRRGLEASGLGNGGVGAAELAVLHPAWHTPGTAACLVDIDFAHGRRDPAALDAIARSIARGASVHARGLSGSSEGASCPSWLASNTDSTYFGYVRPPTLGRATPLINGRSSGGPGPDVDSTEPLDAMQSAVAACANGDSVYLSAWILEPDTRLTAGSYGAATTWGGLFAA